MTALARIKATRDAKARVTVNDSGSTRSASATASVWTGGKTDYQFREVQGTIESFFDAKVGGLTESSGGVVSFRIHSGSADSEIRHVTVDLQGAELGDLPLIAVALLGAIREGIKTGSLPPLEGVE